MLSLAYTTDLLSQTIDQLTGEPAQLTPQAGLARIDEWLFPLSEAENMKPVAAALTQLKLLLQASPVDEKAIQAQLGTVADALSLLSADMGSEGEMPGLFDALASALRQTGSVSREINQSPA
ncbi:hypothetical protein [Fibrella forsythiae]|uniref:Uncharacterized protein n=1 Tax=Fibrella forsythiae TaxID=2817061 RepID=A0ABS3JUS6_9BACT|nr:hypothetical protein [Fibrella forsythiae]MBO0952949.1 hypothetical protein [Fibrella forsythiae]